MKRHDDDWEDDNEPSWNAEGDDDNTMPCPYCKRPIYEDAPRCLTAIAICPTRTSRGRINLGGSSPGRWFACTWSIADCGVRRGAEGRG